MSNCNFKIKLNDEIKTFNDEKSLKDFISRNFYRIKELDYTDLIHESTSGVNSFEESKSKLNAIVKESDGFTSELDSHGEKLITGRDFKGVNRFLNGEDAKSESGKYLTTQYREEEFIKNTMPSIIAKFQNDPSFSGADEETITKAATDYIQDLLKQNSQLGKFGTEFHYISELFFKGHNDINDIMDELSKKFPNKKFNKGAVEKMYNYVKKVTNDIKSIHGESCIIYPEFVVHDPDSKIVGIIDLLVLDENGKTHIYDYKFSHKQASEWSGIKLNRMKYQMAFYNQLLMKKGLLSNSITILPLDMTNVDFVNEVINDIDTEQLPINITSDIQKTFYQYEANRFIPVSFSDFLDESSMDKEIKDELMKSFGYAIQTNIDISGFKPKKGEDGVEFFYDQINGNKTIRLDGTPEENQKIIDEYKRSYMASENHELSVITDNIKKFLKGDENVMKTIYRDENRKNSFFNLFNPYKNSEWRLLKDKELMSLGIVAFENVLTGSVDFISFTSHDLNDKKKVKLNKGTTILGNFYDDRYLLKDKDIFDSTVKNIESLKIAMWINSKAEMFNTGRYSIGEMRVSNIRMNDIKGTNPKDVMHNYGRLTKETGFKLNIKQLKYTNPYNLILAKVVSLLNNDHEAIGYSKSVLRNLNKITSGEEISFTKFENLTAEQIIEKLKILNDLQKELGTIDREKLDPNNEMHSLYYLIAQSIAYYNGLEVGYVDDLKNAAFNESRQFSSIQNIANETIKQFYKVIKRATDAIGESWSKEDANVNKYILKYFEDSGFNRIQQVTFGSAKDAYENLWERDSNNKIDSDFRVKNPDDPNNASKLTEYEKVFLRNLLNTFAKYKYKSEQEIEEAKNSGDYYKIPLIKARGVTRLKQKGVINTIKNSAVDAVNFNNYFQEETLQNQSHLTQMESMYNQFNIQKNGNHRENMISEFGVDEFEHDLQTVLKTYILASVKEKEFNKILPLINSIRTINIYKNQNLSTSVTKHLDGFMNDYIQSVIFNEKLIEEGQEKLVRISSKLKEITSIGLLGFNFAGGVRDFFQGMINNTINVAAKSFGYDIDRKALTEAYGILFSESKNFGKNVNLIDMINSRYMMSFKDTNLLADRSMIGQNGIFTFRSEQMYWMNSLADFQNRMSLFLARMIQDGSYDAHSLVDGEMKYNWKLDKRFNIYSKGKSMQNHPEYGKQEGLYLSMIREFNEQNLTDVPLKVGDDLPKAYTSSEIEGIKRFANLIHGYYDQDSKIMFQQTWIGISMMQFKSWLKAKVDQYTLKRNYYNTGKREQALDPITGEPQWFDRDDDGNLFVTNKDTGIPVYKISESLMEGMFVSFVTAVKTLHACKYDVKEFGRILKDDDLMKGNLIALSADLSVYAIVTALIASIDWPEFQEDQPVLAKFSRTVARAADDLYIVNNLKMVVDPQSLIPSVSYAFDTMDTLSNMWLNPIGSSKKLMNQVGFARPFSYVLDEE